MRYAPPYNPECRQPQRAQTLDLRSGSARSGIMGAPRRPHPRHGHGVRTGARWPGSLSSWSASSASLVCSHWRTVANSTSGALVYPPPGHGLDLPKVVQRGQSYSNVRAARAEHSEPEPVLRTDHSCRAVGATTAPTVPRRRQICRGGALEGGHDKLSPLFRIGFVRKYIMS